MRDDPADLLKRHVPLGPQGTHHEQGKQVLVAVEPHRIVLAEAALDRGDDETGLFPVPQSPHGHAGETAGLGVGKSENFLTIVRHSVNSFLGCSDAKRGSRARAGARPARPRSTNMTGDPTATASGGLVPAPAAAVGRVAE